MLTLFDQIERTDDGPAMYAEPNFRYWNRSARKDIACIRGHLEDWFTRYPTEHQRELRTRFRSTNDVNGQDAFFELFLHEMLLRLGHSVEIHPKMPDTSRRPDFLVSSPDDSRFYLEATVSSGESKKEVAARARTNRVYDAINEMESPDYWINAQVRGAPRSSVPTRKLKTFLNEKLGSLDYEEILKRFERNGFDKLPRWHYEFEGWDVEFFPIPKQNARGNREIRGPMGLRMFGPQWIDPVSPVRDSVLAKAKRYGSPDLPFVIAVNALGGNFGNDEVLEMLFGDECLISRFPGDQFRASRKPNGVWASRSGIRYTRVSAVLVFQKLRAWDFPNTNVRLYHHPSAAKKYEGALNQLPQAIVVNDQVEYIDGCSLGDLFRISTDGLQNLHD